MHQRHVSANVYRDVRLVGDFKHSQYVRCRPFDAVISGNGHAVIVWRHNEIGIENNGDLIGCMHSC
jgi:hypothetical protein